MAAEIRSFVRTISVGSTPDNPNVWNLTMPPRIVRSIRVRIPPGPRGEVGFAIGAAGTAVIPATSVDVNPLNPKVDWIIADDEALSWDLEGGITSGAWQILGYNTGQFPHTIYVTFAVDLLSTRVTVGAASAALNLTGSDL